MYQIGDDWKLCFSKKCEPDKATLDRVVVVVFFLKSFWVIGNWNTLLLVINGHVNAGGKLLCYIGVKEKCFEMIFIIAKI